MQSVIPAVDCAWAGRHSARLTPPPLALVEAFRSDRVQGLWSSGGWCAVVAGGLARSLVGTIQKVVVGVRTGSVSTTFIHPMVANEWEEEKRGRGFCHHFRPCGDRVWEGYTWQVLFAFVTIVNTVDQPSFLRLLAFLAAWLTRLRPTLPTLIHDSWLGQTPS